MLLALAWPLPADAVCSLRPAGERPVVMMCQMIDESGTGWVPDFLMWTRQGLSLRPASRVLTR